MADIGNEIDAIRAAKYGEEVRGEIADALEAMNGMSELAEAWATGGEGGTPGATNNAEYWAGQAEISAVSGIAALANEAPTFDATADYNAGDYVIYDGTLYRFMEAHAAGAWTGADVLAVKIGPELKNANDALALMIDAYYAETLIEGYTWAQGALDTTTGSTTTAIRSKRARSYYIRIDEKPIRFVIPSGWQYRIFKYREQLGIDEDGYIGYEPASSWYSGDPTLFPKCRYIRIVVRKSDDTNFSYSSLPAESLYGYTVNEDEDYLTTESKRLGLHAVPTSIGALNIVKRARQLTDILWSSEYRVKRISLVTNDTYSEGGGTFEDYFEANREYMGLPYSRASFVSPDYGYGKYYIGGTVNFEAFLSSLHYPNSGLATLGAYDASNSASYFGTTCATLQAYVYNSDPYATTYYNNDSTLVKIGALVTSGTRIDYHLLEIGDCLGYVNHHAAIITDIIAENDELKFVEVSESTKFGNYNADYKGGDFGGKTRRKMWGADDFFTWFNNFNVYRLKETESIGYTPIPALKIKDGLPFDYCTAFPCIPFMGNKFNYIKGYIPNSTVLIGDTHTYTHLVVEKDGSPWNVDGTTDPYPLNSDVIDIGFEDVGQYKAYLAKIENGTVKFISYPCVWNVCEAVVTASIANNVATITCQTTENNKPRSVLFGSSFPGRPCSKITEEDYTDTPVSGNLHEYVITIPAPTGWSYTKCILLLENELGVWHSAAATLSN